MVALFLGKFKETICYIKNLKQLSQLNIINSF